MTPEVIRLQNSHAPAPLTFGGLGDAYGFCFEFTSAEFVQANNDLNYHQHPEFTNVSPGAYSDDTQMQLALAEVIASEMEWTAENIAESFVAVFKRNPRQGYASRFFEFLKSINSGQELIEKIIPKSERNGAAMRAPIIGLFPSIDDLIAKSEVQAKITHNTLIGIDSAIAAALMSHFFAYNLGSKEELPSFLNNYLPKYDWHSKWTDPVPVEGIITVKAALSAILETDSLADLLKLCVSYTGDVDSVATIALASASSYQGFARDIPNQLWSGFEDNMYGLRYLLNLDSKVRATIAKLNSPSV